MLHFGYGDLIVSTAHMDKELACTAPEEVIITPTSAGNEIGADAPLGGKTTKDLMTGIRMCFDRRASVQVLIDALEKVKPNIPE